MNVHKNARLTPRGRAILVHRIEHEGWPVSRAAEAAGVSRRTAWRWRSRYRRDGEAGLQDRSSRPHSCPHALPGHVIAHIERLRRQRLTGQAISEALGLARSTIGAVLRRIGLGKLSALEPKAPVIRYERAAPGELIHLDIKKLGRIARPGHRVTGQRKGCRNDGSGWDFLHVCVDDASRLAYTEILPSENQHDASAFLTRALDWLARHGVKTERVMTDNGACYRSKRFGGVVRAAGAKHIFTRPYRPQTNGKAERFIQSSLREWAYAKPYASSQDRAQAIHAWTDAYNTSRPHAGIGGITPWQRVNNLLGNDT